MNDQTDLEIPIGQWPNSSIQILDGRGRLSLDSTTEGIAVVQDGVMKLVNPSLSRLVGYSKQELTSRPLLDFIHPEDRQTVAEYHLRRLNGEEVPTGYSIRIVDARGNMRWIEVKTLLLDWDGRPAILVFLDDITQRRKIEEDMQERERGYRLLEENISDVIWVTDMELRLTYISPSVTRLLGYTVEETMALRFEDALTRVSVEAGRGALAAGLVGRKEDLLTPQTLQVEMKRKDGSTVWAESTHRFVWDRNGQPFEILGVLRDITERKKAEETLRASEEKYRLLTEKMNDIIWTLDLSLRTTYVSPSIEKVLGFTPEERLTQHPQMQMTPESFAQVQAALSAELEREGERGPQFNPERTVKIDVEYYRRNGSTVWLENLVGGIRDAHGTLVGMHGVSRDISERKKAQQALLESERRYRLLAENVSDVIWVTDMNLRPAYISPSVTRLLDYSVEEAMSGTAETRLTAASLKAARAIFARVLAMKQKTSGPSSGEGTLELEFRRKDGSTVWADTTVSFLRDSHGRPVEIVGVLRDISERKSAQEQLHHSLRMLERTIEDTVQAMASMVETKDRYTAGHQRRVAYLACAIAREMGLSSDRIRTIRTAGLLHDLGKISLPTEILSRPGDLTELEFAVIKTHCQAGYDILQNIGSFGQVAEIVLQHHERLNGSGYPFGLRGEEILLEARILAVSDVVEAMFSDRPYRPALGLDKALEEIMQHSSTLYDPDVVIACSRVFSERAFEFDEEETEGSR